MTVSAQIPIVSYTYAGSATFVFSFQVLQAGDLVVTVDGSPKTLGVDYTISGVGVATGGSITYTGTLTLGQTVVLRRVTARTRTADYQSNGDFLASTVNADFDRVVMMAQETDATSARALLVPAGETPGALPSAAARASRLMAFDASGNPIVLAGVDSGSAAALGLDLASAATGKGDALIAVKRTDIASAVALTLHDWNQAERVNVLQVGVKGDGSTDDAALLNVLGALGVPLFIPYTATGYKIGSTVTFACDVWCDGTLIPTTAIGGAVADYNRFAVVIASAGYAVKRKIIGLRVAGSVALRAANVSGIRNDCENSLCVNLHAYQLNYGIVARSYSQTYEKCNANQCNTNFAAYARSSSLEVNALTIRGGNYDSPVVRSVYLGDTTWSDAWGGGNYHGSVIWIGGGVNFDGGEVKIDWCTTIKMDTGYTETSATNYGVVLGGGADGSVRNVDISNWFFKTLRIAIKCLSAVNGLKVGRNFYTGVTHSALYTVNDLYHIEYQAGDATASFTLGREFHTGFRSLAVGSVTFGNITAPAEGIYRGRQTLLQDVGIWYPTGVLQSGATVKTNLASSACRYYTTPATGKAGTVSGGVFTFTTPADCAAFNGGDAIVTSPAGAVYVRSVDYEAGTMVIDGGVTATGAATVSQQAVVFMSRTVSNSGAAPASGTWAKGDIADNGTATVGQPKRWLCTVAGTPGTWVSEGNL